ncbi:MAG: hypothetical protein KTR32_43685 [Granulosicoccus sp.]|nr:hypothetical protein [Granulosicoccus sp.]
MIFRTALQKADLESSFNRPDRPFFASGACHILAHAFLDTVPSNGWKTILILPQPGFRGSHVFASNKKYAFDYHGFTPVSRFQEHYFNKMKRWYPGWSADTLELDISPISSEFCSLYGHRLPQDFYKDPRPRAYAYLKRFDLPVDV